MTKNKPFLEYLPAERLIPEELHGDEFIVTNDGDKISLTIYYYGDRLGISLTKDQTKELCRHLMAWAETGTFKVEEDGDR